MGALVLPCTHPGMASWPHLTYGAGDYSRQQRTSSRGSSRGSNTSSANQQKQELDDIEARKFERAASDEYVDFEELPKE